MAIIQRQLNQADLNRIELQDAIEAIEPEAALTVRQEKDGAGNVIDPAYITIECSDPNEAAIAALVDSHTPVQTEEESKEELRERSTELGKRRFLRLLQDLSPAQRLALRNYLQNLLA